MEERIEEEMDMITVYVLTAFVSGVAIGSVITVGSVILLKIRERSLSAPVPESWRPGDSPPMPRARNLVEPVTRSPFAPLSCREFEREVLGLDAVSRSGINPTDNPQPADKWLPRPKKREAHWMSDDKEADRFWKRSEQEAREAKIQSRPSTDRLPGVGWGRS
jgi:hypothetical protein